MRIPSRNGVWAEATRYLQDCDGRLTLFARTGYIEGKELRHLATLGTVATDWAQGWTLQRGYV